MLIPLTLVKILAGIVIGLGYLAIVAVAAIGAYRLLDHIFRAVREALIFFGVWSSFYNYLTAIQLAADGGREWTTFLDPQNPKGGQEHRRRVVLHYFKVQSKPEFWRWWMRLLGIKKPKPDTRTWWTRRRPTEPWRTGPTPDLSTRSAQQEQASTSSQTTGEI